MRLALLTPIWEVERCSQRWEDVDPNGERRTIMWSPIEIRGGHSFEKPKSR